MAAVEIVISGILYDKLNRTTQNVVLVGEASLQGVGVGGGPIIPPPGSGGAHPEHPIYYPDRIWGGGNVPMPNPPIYIPQPPTEPPVDGGDKPPPAQGGWAYVAEWNAWGYFPMASGAAPKRP